MVITSWNRQTNKGWYLMSSLAWRCPREFTFASAAKLSEHLHATRDGGRWDEMNQSCKRVCISVLGLALTIGQNWDSFWFFSSLCYPTATFQRGLSTWFGARMCDSLVFGLLSDQGWGNLRTFPLHEVDSLSIWGWQPLYMRLTVPIYEVDIPRLVVAKFFYLHSLHTLSVRRDVWCATYLGLYRKCKYNWVLRNFRQWVGIGR